MARILSSPFLLGFDEIERTIDRASRPTSDGYPPYNIDRVQGQQGQASERLRITLAVAGFTPNQLELAVDKGHLFISGRQADDKDRHFLYRGIASRQFQRVFLLADGMQVLEAKMRDGLLRIDLVRPQPMKYLQKIEINIEK